jgi:hypothetical protein
LSNLIPATPNPLFPEKPHCQSPNNTTLTSPTTNTPVSIPKRSVLLKTKQHCETEKSEPQIAGILGPLNILAVRERIKKPWTTLPARPTATTPVIGGIG